MKKLNKILAIMLSIVMITGFTPVNTLAESGAFDVIDYIVVDNVQTPYIGENPRFDMYVSKSLPYHLASRSELKALGYEDYNSCYNGTWWMNFPQGESNEDNYSFIGPNDKFYNNGSNQYAFDMVVVADNGFTFAPYPMVIINGVPEGYVIWDRYDTDVFFGMSGMVSAKEKPVEKPEEKPEEKPVKMIDNVSISGLDAPTFHGQTDCEVSLPENANYRFATVDELKRFGFNVTRQDKGMWWRDTVNGTILCKDYYFNVGNYVGEFVLVPNEGYKFPEKNNLPDRDKITVNGSKDLVDDVKITNDYIHITTKSFNVEKQKIADFTLNGAFTKINNNTYKIRETGRQILADPIVTNADGKIIEDSRDNPARYVITYSSEERVKPGVYTITVEGISQYQGTIKKTLIVTPKPVTNVKARMCKYAGGYDDAYITWNKAPYASGYQVYYRRPSITKNWTSIGMTTKTSFVKKDMYDGYKYEFKVVPYIKSGNNYYRTTSDYKVVSMNTLKKVNAPFVGKYNNSKVRVKWNNIYGESGYQISRSTKKTGTYIVNTYPTATGNYRLLNTRRNTGYYYKVRAYKVVDGTKVFAPWSNVKYFKLR